MKLARSVALNYLEKIVTPDIGHITQTYLEILLKSEKDPKKQDSIKIAIECVKECREDEKYGRFD